MKNDFCFYQHRCRRLLNFNIHSHIQSTIGQIVGKSLVPNRKSQPSFHPSSKVVVMEQEFTHAALAYKYR